MEKLISKKRSEKYTDRGKTPKDGFLEDMKLANNFYKLLYALEILLRNSIDKELSRVFGEDWVTLIIKGEKDKQAVSMEEYVGMLDCRMDVSGFYVESTLQTLLVDEEFNRINRRKKDATRDDIISNTSFGFWVKVIENLDRRLLDFRVNDNGICAVYTGAIFPFLWKSLLEENASLIKDYEPENWSISFTNKNNTDDWNKKRRIADLLEMKVFSMKKEYTKILPLIDHFLEDIARDLRVIQDFRNRIFHFKTIIDTDYKTMESLIIKYIKAISPKFFEKLKEKG